MMDCKAWDFRLDPPEDESSAERKAREFWKDEWEIDEIDDEDEK